MEISGERDTIGKCDILYLLLANAVRSRIDERHSDHHFAKYAFSPMLSSERFGSAFQPI